MPRVFLDLNTAQDRQKVKGQWRRGEGYVPGEPNEGLKARATGSPARLAEYDDSKWPVCDNIRQSISTGFTFAWYRITIEIPQTVNGAAVAGSRVFFETSPDNYGEVWVNGQITRGSGTIEGINPPQRVEISNKAEPGSKHTIACLVANGPLGEPRGGVFMRYGHLTFETAN